jgi:hypothetical protein
MVRPFIRIEFSKEQAKTMRLNRGTIALLLVSVVAIIAIALFRNQPPAATTPTPIPTGTTTGPIFTAIDTSTVNRFEVVDNTTGQRTVLTRDAALVWAVAETAFPNTQPVDQARINTQLGGFTTLNATDRFAATNLADFGLDTPAYTISITRLDGTVNRIQVGNTNPGASRYYVLVDNQTEVILVQQAAIAGMTSMVVNPPFIPVPTATPGTSTPDTRRPLLTGITADQITSLVITNNSTGASTNLAKDASLNWTVVATNGNATRQVDQFATFTAAANFTGLQYTDSFGPSDLPVFRLEDFGLDRPAYTIVATTNSGMQHTLTIGGLNPGGTEYYVLLTSVQLMLPTATPFPTVEITAEATVDLTAEATAEVTAAIVEATAEATTEATAEATVEATSEATTEATMEATSEATTEATTEATAEATVAATVAPTLIPVEVYLVQRATVDALIALIATPPYLPEVTPTVEMTAEATLSADSTAEATSEATAATDATAEATVDATAEVTAAP